MAEHDHASNSRSVAQQRTAADAPLPKQDASPSKPVIHPHGTAPLPKDSQESLGDKEASWIRTPAQTGGLVHVGSVFFATKSTSLDDRDRTLLHELARGYAGHASTIAPHVDGISGRIVGHADPRPSHEPDNQQLSAGRAEAVWRTLGHALDESATGYHPFEREAGGVEAVAGKEGHAASRRADIFVRGRVKSDQPVVQAAKPPVAKVAAANQPVPAAPDYSGRFYDLDQYRYQIERGDAPTINGIASRIKAFLEFGADANLHQQIASGHIDPVKPPWWDGRTGAALERQMFPRGRPSTDAELRKATLVDKALLLVRDSRELGYYADEAAAAFAAWLSASANGLRALMAEYAKPCAYARFMMEAVLAEAAEVQRLSD